ncbi:MAG: hypothetical protein SFV21_15385 [Rhodospirillaceae bacterium]|nr:hypothetical protein [Rhodospirillaceae bacterium]
MSPAANVFGFIGAAGLVRARHTATQTNARSPLDRWDDSVLNIAAVRDTRSRGLECTQPNSSCRLFFGNSKIK